MANKYASQARAKRRGRKEKRMCLRKAKFETEAQAYQKGQRSYKCPFCGKWHRSGSLALLINRIKSS